MAQPAARVLAVLELLQDRPGLTGPAIAADLGVDPRTVRRYVTTLQEMGIPVEGTTGRYGGYRLLPGFRLPPLMFNAEEAVGLAVALLASRGTAGDDLPPAVASAFAKIRRVLPHDLARQLDALQNVAASPADERPVVSGFPDPGVLATLARCVLARQRCTSSIGVPTISTADVRSTRTASSRCTAVGMCTGTATGDATYAHSGSTASCGRAHGRNDSFRRATSTCSLPSNAHWSSDALTASKSSSTRL